MANRTWVASYIYKDAEGAARTGVRLITAKTEQEAHDYAAQNPPSDEFVVSLHPQSDDQLLGSVRQNASRLKELRPDDTGGHALKDVLEMLLADPDTDIGDSLDDFIAELDEKAGAGVNRTANGKS